MIVLRYSYDLAQMLGFLGPSFGNILAMLVLVGLLLHGLSTIFRPSRRAGETEPAEDHSGDIVYLVP